MSNFSHSPVIFVLGKDRFSHLLRVVPALNALFEKQNVLFSVKPFKTKFPLGECRIPNALNLEKLRLKFHNCVLLLDFLVLFRYTVHMPLFSRISLSMANSDWIFQGDNHYLCINRSSCPEVFCMPLFSRIRVFVFLSPRPHMSALDPLNFIVTVSRNRLLWLGWSIKLSTKM